MVARTGIEPVFTLHLAPMRPCLFLNGNSQATCFFLRGDRVIRIPFLNGVEIPAASLLGLAEAETNLCETLRLFVAVLQQHGKQSEAGQVVDEQLAKLQSNRVNTNSLQFAGMLNGFANQVLREAKRYEDAAALEEQALKIQLELPGTNLPLLIETYGGLASVLDVTGKYSNATPLLEERLELIRRLHGNESLQVADALGWNAGVYAKDKRFAEEESALQERLAIQKGHFGSEHTNLLDTLGRLVSNLEARGNSEKSEPLRQELLTLRRKTFGNDDPKTISVRQH